MYRPSDYGETCGPVIVGLHRVVVSLQSKL